MKRRISRYATIPVALLLVALSFSWTGVTSANIELALLLITTALTIITLVLTLAYEPNAQWPPIQSVIPAWLQYALFASSSLSILSLFTPIRDAVGWILTKMGLDNLHNKIDISVAFAAFTFALGSYTAIRLLIESGSAERRKASARILSEGWHRAHQRSHGRPLLTQDQRPIDAAFEQGLRSAILNGNGPEVVNRICEASDAGRMTGYRAHSLEESRYALLADQRLTGHVLKWLVQSPNVGPGMSEQIQEHLIRSSVARAELIATKMGSSEVQRNAAMHLGRLARYYGWAQLASTYQSNQENGRAYASLIESTRKARRKLLTIVDPDPPGKYISAMRPWSRGITHPEAMSLFLWGFAEPMPTDFGASLYAYHEVVTGHKFAKSFSASDACMLTDTYRHVNAGTATLGAASHIQEVGGISRIATDLLISMIAQWPTRALPPPPDLEGDHSFNPPAYRRAKEVKLLTLRDELRLTTANAAIRELSDSLAADSLGGCSSFAGWATRNYMHHEKDFGESVIRVPSPLPCYRYAAAGLATLLRIAPTSSADSTRPAEKYLAALPDQLVREMAEYCAEAGLPSPEFLNQRRKLLEMMEFIKETEI